MRIEDITIVTDEADCILYFVEGLYIGHDSQVDLEELLVESGAKRITIDEAGCYDLNIYDLDVLKGLT